MIKTESGIPLPSSRTERDRKAKYPWRSMKIGDSFLAPDGVLYTSITNQAYTTGMRLGRRYAVRRTLEGIRVWRTE